MEEPIDSHDTHCCIIPTHGCKYSNEDCPIANGIRKQWYLCEHCDSETDDHYCEPKRTYDEQHDYIAALWTHKQNPKTLNPDQKKIMEIIESYGWIKLRNMLRDVRDSELSIAQILEMMEDLKHIGD